MARITVEDCLKIEPNRFQLVHMAIQRAKQILKAQNASVAIASTSSVASKQVVSKKNSVDKSNKPVVIGLREIAAGSVRLMTIEEMNELKVHQEQNAIEDSPMTEADKILTRLGLSTQPDAIDVMLADDSGDSDDDDGEVRNGEVRKKEKF